MYARIHANMDSRVFEVAYTQQIRVQQGKDPVGQLAMNPSLIQSQCTCHEPANYARASKNSTCALWYSWAPAFLASECSRKGCHAMCASPRTSQAYAASVQPSQFYIGTQSSSSICAEALRSWAVQSGAGNTHASQMP